MTQATRDANRYLIAGRLETHREEKRLEEINRQLEAEEAAYRAEVARQMDAGYLFERINREQGKTAVKLYDADTGAMTEAVKDPEWWDEYPQLWGAFCGAGLILGMMIISQFVLAALGLW